MKQLFSTLFFLTWFVIANAQAPATWITVPVPTTKHLTCIDFPTDQVGYIGGVDSLLLKTLDGGNTWNEVSYSGITFLAGGDKFIEIDFVSEDIGYTTVGPYSGTYRTEDGGVTWTPLNLSSSFCFNDGLYFFADGEGFVGGSGCFQGEKISKFTSGEVIEANLDGASFNSQDRIVDIDFDLESFQPLGISVSSSGKIFRTTDLGITWESVLSPLGDQVPLRTVAIVSSDLVFIGYDAEAAAAAGFGLMGLLYSIDGGLTWLIDMNSASFAYPTFNDLHVTSSGRVYCGQTANLGEPELGNIMEFTDTESLPIWNSYLVEHPINSMSSHSDTIVWGAGNNGYLVRRGPAEVLSAKEGSSSFIRCFPNPTHSIIQAEIPSDWIGSNFQMEVISMDGALVMKGALGFSTLNVEDLSPGIYLIKISGEKGIMTSSFMKE